MDMLAKLPVHGKGRTLMVFLVFMAAAFALYGNTFFNQWTYDDFVVLVNNPDIRSLSGFLENSYPGRPLRELTYLVDHALFGLNPAGYHIQNIFWHGLSAFLLFRLVEALTGRRAASWGAALLFLVHPIQVEVVANISHRKDSLALAFSLLALLAYVKSCRNPQNRYFWLVVTAVATLLAILGKQLALTLPLAFLAFEAAFLPPERRWMLRHKWVVVGALATLMAGGGFWLVASGVLQRRIWEIQGVLSRMSYLGTATEELYLKMVLKSWAFMFKKVFLPVDLALEYSYPVPSSWFDPWVLAAIFGAAVYVVGLVLSFRRSPAIFLGLVLLGAFWLPAASLWPRSYLAADRYLYAPSAGLFVVLGILLDRLAPRMQRFKIPLLAIVLAGLCVLTWNQNRVWRSPLSLWTHAVEVSPDSSYALGFLGVVYIEKGEFGRALPLLQRAAENPFNLQAQRALKYVRSRLGSAPGRL